MHNLPVELNNLILSTKGDKAERKAIKQSSAVALWKVVCEMLPDENLDVQEMKIVYYGITANGYMPKYSRMRAEVMYQIWIVVESTNDVFFPQSVCEIAKKYINEKGFLNNLNIYRRNIKNIRYESFYYVNEDGLGSNYRTMFDIDFKEIINLNLNDLKRDNETVDTKVKKIHRNRQDREKRDKDKKLEMGNMVLKPLLVKKRNKDSSFSSKKQNVKNLRMKGFKQEDIANKLGITSRWVRKIERLIEMEDLTEILTMYSEEICNQYEDRYGDKFEDGFNGFLNVISEAKGIQRGEMLRAMSRAFFMKYIELASKEKQKEFDDRTLENLKSGMDIEEAMKKASNRVVN